MGLSWGTRLGESPSTTQGSLCQRPDTRGHLGTFWLESKEPSCSCVSPPLPAECPADAEEVAGQERPGSPIPDPSLPTSGSPEENTLFWTTGGTFLSAPTGGNGSGAGDGPLWWPLAAPGHLAHARHGSLRAGEVRGPCRHPAEGLSPGSTFSRGMSGSIAHLSPPPSHHGGNNSACVCRLGRGRDEISRVHA